MASYRKPLYTPRFGSQSSQTDKLLKHNERRNKLSKTTKKVTCESNPLTTPSGISPEVTPCYSRKVRTNYLLRFYSSGKANRKTAHTSTATLTTSDGGKSQPVKHLTHSKGNSSDHFDFPSEDFKDKPAGEKSRTKQDVLKTVKRMIEENRVIRQRLLALSQMRKSN